jgi:toxin ParE1/3/4
MAHRRAPEADNDLEDIVISLASLGATFATAERIVSEITERFYLLAEYPHLGGARDADLGPGRRSFSVGDYVVIYRIDDGDVLILRVLHARRDIEALFH